MNEPREAGDALDQEIAERVMGWKRLKGTLPVFFDGHLSHYTGPTIAQREKLGMTEHPGAFEPSTDIAAAWKVVENMAERGWSTGLQHMLTAQGWMWRCDLYEQATGGNGIEDKFADTAPLAICLASLAALEALSASPPTSAGNDE